MQPDIRIEFTASGEDVLACLNDKPHIRTLAHRLALMIEEYGEMDTSTAWAAAFTHVVAKRRTRQQAAREGEGE